LFDRSRLEILPVSERANDLSSEDVKNLEPRAVTLEGIKETAEHISRAKIASAARVFMMGAHVLRDGVQRYVIDMMERGFISCVAMNGAGVIHDYEFALIGQTTESVARYIRDGSFGLWRETGIINDIVASGAKKGEGIGETIGRAISDGDFPHKDISLCAAAWRLGIPVTVHVGIGYDILCEHPSYDGAAWGSASYTDFLILARELLKLEGGVVMNFGSAVMAPEVYLKALAMARNAARGGQKSIARFATLVCDLHDFPTRVSEEAPKNSAAYYYRPWKTMLVRTVADGGEGWYVRGRHEETVPQLWTALRGEM
jgi:hypothetical protein